MKKADAKGLYDYVLQNGGSTKDALCAVMVNEYGTTFFRALALVEERFGENTMPPDCIAVLDEVYGKRLEKMKPVTIFNKVRTMMQQVEGNPDEEGITDAVNSYLN